MQPNNEKQPHKSASKTKTKHFVLAPDYSQAYSLRAASMDMSPLCPAWDPEGFPNLSWWQVHRSRTVQKLSSISRGRKQDISRGISHLGSWRPPCLEDAAGTPSLTVVQARLVLSRASAHFQDAWDLENYGMKSPLCILSCTYGASTALH